MPRCLHIYDSGFQCIDETVPEGDFYMKGAIEEVLEAAEKMKATA